MDESLYDGIAGLENGDRSTDRIRLSGQNGGRKTAKRIVVIGIAARQRLDALQAILCLPRTHQIRRQRIQADRLGLQRIV